MIQRRYLHVEALQEAATNLCYATLLSKGDLSEPSGDISLVYRASRHEISCVYQASHYVATCLLSVLRVFRDLLGVGKLRCFIRIKVIANGARHVRWTVQLQAIQSCLRLFVYLAYRTSSPSCRPEAHSRKCVPSLWLWHSRGSGLRSVDCAGSTLSPCLVVNDRTSECVIEELQGCYTLPTRPLNWSHVPLAVWLHDWRLLMPYVLCSSGIVRYFCFLLPWMTHSTYHVHRVGTQKRTWAGGRANVMQGSSGQHMAFHGQFVVRLLALWPPTLRRILPAACTSRPSASSGQHDWGAYVVPRPGCLICMHMV